MEILGGIRQRSRFVALQTAGVKLVSNVKLFSHLANIGDTRSLIIHPASTTHRQLNDAQKVAAGWPAAC